MAATYFAALVSEPVTILLWASEERYRAGAERLFGDRDVSRYGYYRPHLRVLLVNIERGPDALLHELTHALMAFDFPAAPEWLGEGLASLHESVEIHDDERGLVGLANWRLPTLQQAIRQRRLRSLRDLLAAADFHGQEELLNYAQARYFCMYLQDRGLLAQCYRSCRGCASVDPIGRDIVAGLFPGRTWEQIDADFQAWAGNLK
jgi:hypothetical protein